MATPSKTVKRKRRVNGSSSRSMVALNRKVNILAKRFKQSNPLHLYFAALSTSFSSLSTTGTQIDVCSGIAQGDDYYQRTGDTIRLKRLIVHGVVHPGGTSTGSSVVRITVIRGQAGLAFAANMATPYSPIISNESTQLLFDKFYDIAGSQAQPGFPGNVEISIEMNHLQKFTSNVAASTAGSCIYMICQSGVAAGTAAPFWAAGFFELYFMP